jgi:hypothetical protein
MITKLDNKYLVCKWDDINKYLNNSEKRRLSMIIDKISVNRHKDGKAEKNFAVVSESMDIYSDVVDKVLNEINGVKAAPPIPPPPASPKGRDDREKAEIITNATTKIAPKKKTTVIKKAGVKDVKD